MVSVNVGRVSKPKIELQLFLLLLQEVQVSKAFAWSPSKAIRSHDLIGGRRSRYAYEIACNDVFFRAGRTRVKRPRLTFESQVVGGDFGWNKNRHCNWLKFFLPANWLASTFRMIEIFRQSVDRYVPTCNYREPLKGCSQVVWNWVKKLRFVYLLQAGECNSSSHILKTWEEPCI